MLKRSVLQRLAYTVQFQFSRTNPNLEVYFYPPFEEEYAGNELMIQVRIPLRKGALKECLVENGQYDRVSSLFHFLFDRMIELTLTSCATRYDVGHAHSNYCFKLKGNLGAMDSRIPVTPLKLRNPDPQFLEKPPEGVMLSEGFEQFQEELRKAQENQPQGGRVYRSAVFTG